MVGLSVGLWVRGVHLQPQESLPSFRDEIFWKKCSMEWLCRQSQFEWRWPTQPSLSLRRYPSKDGTVRHTPGRRCRLRCDYVRVQRGAIRRGDRIAASWWSCDFQWHSDLTWWQASLTSYSCLRNKKNRWTHGCTRTCTYARKVQIENGAQCYGKHQELLNPLAATYNFAASPDYCSNIFEFLNGFFDLEYLIVQIIKKRRSYRGSNSGYEIQSLMW